MKRKGRGGKERKKKTHRKRSPLGLKILDTPVVYSYKSSSSMVKKGRREKEKRERERKERRVKKEKEEKKKMTGIDFRRKIILYDFVICFKFSIIR